MTQQSPVKFTVADGETVQVRVETLQTTFMGKATFARHHPTEISSFPDPTVYEFKVNGPSGQTFFFSFTGLFPAGSSDQSEYVLHLKGDQSESEFLGPVGLNADGVTDLDVQIKVA